MDSASFKAKMQCAETMRRAASDLSGSRYWQGYITGLRKSHHGEKFGTEEDHERMIKSRIGGDVASRWIGIGYRDGLHGVNPDNKPEIVRALMVDREWSQSRLAGRIGVDRSTVGRWVMTDPVEPVAPAWELILLLWRYPEID